MLICGPNRAGRIEGDRTRWVQSLYQPQMYSGKLRQYSRALVEWGREHKLNLKVAAVRRVLNVLAVVCLLNVGARISGADFESQQPQALIPAVQASQRLSGVSLTSRISYSLFSNALFHAKQSGELQRPTHHLPVLRESRLVAGGMCRQFSPALAFPQFGRSPPSLTT